MGALTEFCVESAALRLVRFYWNSRFDGCRHQPFHGARTWKHFCGQIEVELGHVDYREHNKLPAKEEGKVLADVVEQAERWIELEDFVPTAWSIPFELPGDLPQQAESFDKIEKICTSLRTAWNLGLNPIPDLIDTLESKGVKVFVTRYDGYKNFGSSEKLVGKTE